LKIILAIAIGIINEDGADRFRVTHHGEPSERRITDNDRLLVMMAGPSFQGVPTER
jgi:hypothetical protein